ncbi:MAG TPA: HNH endonuclease [Acidimicrobiales bacterium]|nr:HNH endonuclease [Acidimicrobiales bacterium]
MRRRRRNATPWPSATGTARSPGCRRPAKWTDVHHIVAFKPGSANGGRTDLDNLLLLCDVHHRLVHEGHWRLDGTAFDFDVHRPDGTRFDHITRGPP